MRKCIGCSAPASPKGQWCSQACNALHRRTGSERKCFACDATYYRRPGESSSPKFCSDKCRREHERRHSKNYPKSGHRALHRIVMEQKLGRALSSTEVVHHINNDKLDFAIDNLELKDSQATHMKGHWADGSVSMTHEEAVARGRRSGEARRARKLAQ